MLNIVRAPSGFVFIGVWPGRGMLFLCNCSMPERQGLFGMDGIGMAHCLSRPTYILALTIRHRVVFRMLVSETLNSVSISLTMLPSKLAPASGAHIDDGVLPTPFPPGLSSFLLPLSALVHPRRS